MIRRYSSGGPWEEAFGYSRVVVAGDLALVAGCTSTVDGGVTHVGDAAEQMREAASIALAALSGAGVVLAQIVRTRIYLVSAGDADAVGRVHGEIFGAVRPVATMVVVAGLLHPDHLVEVEVEAYTG